ncbi:carbohydrate-binding module family 19 protein [Phycomyces blakesleeanus]|uniref:chitinase n=1 Tax=Phycomyces blakesleeanus TaxID=4837 RepID=A0ABR3AU97_PHYBL
MIPSRQALSIFGAITILANQALAGSLVMQYWGQNSANGASTQKPLASYCDGSADVIIMSFLYQFNLGGLPVLNLANACTEFYPGTQQLNCPQVSADIKTCQSKGVKILLSLGGASGAYGFQSDDQGTAFAQTLWNLFGKGTASNRPFQDAVLDGFDLDIEGGGSTGYATLVTSLRTLFNSDSSKTYMITAAPQCPFPDAMLGSVINAVGFDVINVQFYNNYCSPTSSNFNFNAWDAWAKSTSPNKNVQIFLTVPGSPSAAGSGYVPFVQLSSIVKSVASQYSSYGGVSVWDASQSYSNTEVSPDFAHALAQLVHGTSVTSPGGNSPTTIPVPTTTPTNTQSASTAPTSSPSPPATGPLTGTCVTNGQSCSTTGQLTCSGSGYGLCSNGKWSVQNCPPNTQCFATTDSSSVYCGAATGTSTCSNAIGIKGNPSGSSGVSVPKPYTSGQVSAQVSVASSNTSNFTFVINARRLNTMPFGSNIVVKFNISPGLNITEVENGVFQQTGSLVSIQINNTEKQSMAIVFSVSGTLSNTVFVAPIPSTMTFQT